jgi:hypothetical protein
MHICTKSVIGRVVTGLSDSNSAAESHDHFKAMVLKLDDFGPGAKSGDWGNVW